MAGAIVAAVVGGIALGALTTDDSPTIAGPSASHLTPIDADSERDEALLEAPPATGGASRETSDDGAGPGQAGAGAGSQSAARPSVPAEQVTEAERDDLELPPAATVVEQGHEVEIGGFLVTFGATDVDAGWRFDGNENTSAYVDELSEDEILVVGSVTVTNQSDAPLDPTVDLFTSFLGSDGRDYNLLNGPFCMTEDSLMHVGNLAPGQSTTGTVCQGVPASAARGGVWQLRPDSDYSAVTYFATHDGLTR